MNSLSMTLWLDSVGSDGSEILVQEFPFHIGRSTGNDLVLPDTLASRKHAVLLLEPEGVVLVDHNSSNGTWVNEELVTRKKLGAKDIVRIGNSKLTVTALHAPAHGKVTTAPQIVLERDADDLQTSDSGRRRLLHRPISELALEPLNDSDKEVAALAIVHRLAQQLSNVTTLPDLAGSAMGLVREILEDSAGAILAYPIDGRGIGWRQTFRFPSTSQPLSKSIVREAIARRALLVARDTLLAADLPAKRTGTLQRLRSVLCAPFFRERELRFLLYVSHHEATLSDLQVELLSALAAQAYLAFERIDAVDRLIAYGRDIAQKDRLAALGKLVAVLTHEIRTPLTVARGEVELAQIEATDRIAASRLSRALDAIDRVSETIGRTLSYAREAPAASRSLDVRSVAETAVRLVEQEVRARCVLEQVFVPSPWVAGEEARLGQVVVNLVRNALEAFDPGRRDENRLTIEVRPAGMDATRLTVSDNGPGISAELLPRVFDPFVTGRAERGGTGLGLAICKDVVTEMRGTIEVHSEPGKGATFTIVLPSISPPSGVDERTRT